MASRSVDAESDTFSEHSFAKTSTTKVTDWQSAKGRTAVVANGICALNEKAVRKNEQKQT